MVRVVDLPFAAAGLNPASDFGYFSCEEAIQLAYGMSVVLLWCLLVNEIMLRVRGAPKVFLHQ